MKTSRWEKLDFNPKAIEYFCFWGGIGLGVGYAVILSFLFKLFLEIPFYLATNGCFFDWYTNGYSSIFIVTLSFGLSFCITTSIWMRSANLIRKKSVQKWFLYASCTVVSMFYIVLLPLQGIYSLYVGLIFYWDISLGVLLILPLFLYLYCWNLIKKIFKVSKAFLYMSLFGILEMVVIHIFVFK